MAWWSIDNDVPDFDVYLSVGVPSGPAVTSDEIRGEPLVADPSVGWADAIIAVTRTILSSGGRIVVGFDPDVTPLLAAVGFEFASARPAEEPDDRNEAPITVFVDNAALRDLTDLGIVNAGEIEIDGREPAIILSAWMGLSLLTTDSRADDRGRVPLARLGGNSPAFAIALWPDARSFNDLDVLTQFDDIAIFDSPLSSTNQMFRQSATASEVMASVVAMRDQRTVADLPWNFVIHSLIDRWVSEGDDRRRSR